MPKLLPAALLWSLASVSFSQVSHPRVRDSFDDSLGKLARAATLTQLEILWASDSHDFPHRAVHAAMYSKLGGPNPDPVLIGAMPTNGEEMQALYDAQDTAHGQDMAVTEARNEFYSKLTNALSRNPAKLPQFLRMIHAFHFVDNVDEWPWLCGLASTIFKAHPSEYMNAVGSVGKDYEKEALECKEPPDAP